MRMSLAKAIGKRHAFDSPSLEAMLLLMRVTDLMQRRSAEVLKRESLTGPQYNVLRILRGHGRPCTCSEIAGQLIVQDPDVTRLIDRLEKRALIERIRCTEDRRVVWVKITDAGTTAVARLDQPNAQLLKANFKSLTETEIRSLISLLTKLMDA